MAMNKSEQAEMARLRRDLELVRALHWPPYPMPAPMTEEEIKANLVDGGMRYGKPERVARGWFAHPSSERPRVTYGCSNGMHCNSTGDATVSQGMGTMYPTKLDALHVIRLKLTEKYAEALVEIDRMIAEEEMNPG